MPIRSMYSTDSASMLGKAKQLIAAAKEYLLKKEAGGGKAHMRNPFRKPWGLQKDGDLWEQAWKAIVKRGPGNQD